MSKVQCPSGIPAAEWAATPASVQQLVLTLLQMNEELRERIGKLEERLNQNSQNSSQPPSADGPSKPMRPPKAASGR
jgi:phosphoribosylcarboxyaminoimidazole (NCAIR) mutase